MTSEMMTTAPEAQPILKNKKKQAEKVIKKYTLVATGAALVPINLVDVVSSTIAQTMMIRDLCKLYDVEFSDKLTNVAVWSTTGSIVTKVISSVVANVVGSPSGSQKLDLTGAAIAGIYTAAIGEFYHLHFERGGNLSTLKVSDFIDYFIDEIKRGDLNSSVFTNPTALLSHLKIV